MSENRKWDTVTIIFHWLTAAAAALLLATGLGAEVIEESMGEASEKALMGVHFYVGWLLIVSVSARILWGFFGPENIRWSAMIRNAWRYPAWARAELVFLFVGHHTGERKKTGHNPLAVPVYLFALAMFFVQAGSGLLMSYGEKKESAASHSWSLVSPSPAHAGEGHEYEGHEDDKAESGGGAGREDGEKEKHEFLEDVHELSVVWVPLFLALHLGGMFLHRARGERDVFRSMSPF